MFLDTIDTPDVNEPTPDQLPDFPEPEPDLREVLDRLERLEAILAPLAPFIAQLPEIAAKVDPLMEGLRKSPVLRMIGVNL